LPRGARERGHRSVAAIFEERSQLVDADVRALHELILMGRILEPVAGNRMIPGLLRSAPRIRSTVRSFG